MLGASGDRVAVEFGKNEWYIGTISKLLPKTGYRVTFDDGESSTADPKKMRIVLVDPKTKKVKKPLSLVQMRLLKPERKAATTTTKGKAAPPAPAKEKVAPTKGKEKTAPAPAKPDGKEKSPAVPKQNPKLQPIKTGGTVKPLPPMVNPRKPVAPPSTKPVNIREANECTAEEKMLRMKLGHPDIFSVTSRPDRKLDYLKKVWADANKKLFASKLPPCNIRLSKDTGLGFRRRGSWTAARNEITISPRLFNGQEHHVLTTLVHEMCITGATLIATDVGLIRMDSISTSGASKVMTRDGPADIQKWWKSGDKDTVVIKTQSGISLDLTATHPVLTLSNTGRLVWKDSGDLVVGDYLVRKLGSIVDSETDLSFAMDSQVGIGYMKVHTPKFPTQMTSRLARLLGYLVAEGSFIDGSNPNTIDFSNTDIDIINDYVACWKSCFGFSPDVKGSSTYRVSVTRKDVAAWFSAVGFNRTLSHDRQVPFSILESRRKYIIQFLRAYIEGDGYISERGKVEITSSSHKLVEQLSQLLSSLGLVSRIQPFTARHGYKNGNIYYRLYVFDGEYVAKVIGAISTRRKERMSTVLAYHSEKTLCIPGKHWKIPFVGTFISKSTDVALRVQSGGGIYPGVLSTLLEELPKNLALRMKKLLTQVIFEEIVDITASKLVVPVYDMTTSAGQFVANGFVVHNCHQAVSRINNVVDRTKGGHGAQWETWMRHCGLTPSRYSVYDNSQFATEDQKRELTEQKLRKEQAQLHVKNQNMRHASLVEGAPAQYFDPKTNQWVKGALACKHDRAGKRWAFVKDPRSTSFGIIPSDWFYAVPENERQTYLTESWTHAASQIVKYYANKAGVRADRAARRRGGLFGGIF